MFWSPKKAGTQVLAHRQVLSCFPNTLSGPFWRHQYFREQILKPELKPASAAHWLFATALKLVQAEVRKCHNAIGSFSHILIPDYHREQPQTKSGWWVLIVLLRLYLLIPSGTETAWLHRCSWKGMVWWKGIKVLISYSWVQGIEHPVDFDTAWQCSVPLIPCNRYGV